MQPAPDTFATKAEADRWLASAVTDQAQGRWVDARAGKISLRRFAVQWMDGKAALAPKTIEPALRLPLEQPAPPEVGRRGTRRPHAGASPDVAMCYVR